MVQVFQGQLPPIMMLPWDIAFTIITTHNMSSKIHGQYWQGAMRGLAKYLHISWLQICRKLS